MPDESRNRLKAEHKCVRCRTPLPEDDPRVTCQACRDKCKRDGKANRTWYIQNGICPRCKKNIIMGAEKNCPECRAVAAEREANRRKVEPDYREKQNTNYRKLYQKRQEKGLCPKCGKRKPSGGFVVCAICRDRSARYKYLHIPRMSNIPLSDRYKYGLCRWCDEPVLPGYKVCDTHYKKTVEKLDHPKVIEARNQIKKRWQYGKSQQIRREMVDA